MIKKFLKFSYGVLRQLATLIPVGNVILFEASYDYGGNAGTVYSYLKNHEYSKKYKLVWVSKNKSAFKKDGCCDVIPYLGHSIKNLYYENRAKYIFYDNMPPIAKLKKNVCSVYLTHGCPPLKNCRGKINAGRLSTAALCTSSNLIDLISEQYNIKKEKIFLSGLPRNDIFYSDKKTNEIKKITSSPYSKAVIWMPTFRKLSIPNSGTSRNDSDKEYFLGLPTIDNKAKLDTLNNLLKKQDTLLLIKFHFGAFTEEFSDLKYSNIVLMDQKELDCRNINLYSLLNETDALISDYSSVTFDYLNTGKPIGYIIDDMNEYKLGFAFDNITDYMPGELIRSYKELEGFISSLNENTDKYSNDRKKVLDAVNDFQNGNNAKHIAEMFIEK